MIKKLLFILACIFSFGNLFSQWVQVGSGANAPVNDLIVYNNALVAGGQFVNIGGGIATWDGSNWTAFGQGVDSAGIVYCLDTINGNLYAGGDFGMMNGVPANNIAVWNGSSWSALGGGTNGIVNSIAFLGGEIYVGGQFTMAGNVPANNVAKWDGTNWSALGSGLNCNCFYSFVRSLCVYNNELYAGGLFDSQGNNNIAKWNGSSWSALGSGTDSEVNSLKVFNNELYVGGLFYYVNSVLCHYVAKWNGAWSAVIPNSTLMVSSMSVFNGNLYLVGNAPAGTSFAMWDGQTWTLIYTGIVAAPCAFIPHGIYAVEKFGNDIYLGGFFTQGCAEPGNFIIYANQPIVGVAEEKVEQQMEVLPNPSSGKFSVNFPEDFYTMEVTDLTGKIIYSRKDCTNNSQEDLSGLSDGIYFIRAFNKNYTFTGKIIIRK